MSHHLQMLRIALVALVIIGCCASEHLGQLPTNYSLSFSVNNLLTSKTEVIDEANVQGNSSMTAVQIWNNTLSSSLIVRRSSKDYIFHDGKGRCFKTKMPVNASVVDPLWLSTCAIPYSPTIYDLLEWFGKTNDWTMQLVPSESGQDVERYSAVIPAGDKKHLVNATVVMLKDVRLEEKSNLRMLRFIEIKVYDAKTPEAAAICHNSYNVFSFNLRFDDVTREVFFLPPDGVYCEGPSDIPFPKIDLKNFVASIDVISAERKISDLRLIYSSDYNLASFTNANTSLTFNQNVSVTGETVMVTQDFIYGLQYSVDTSTSACKSVQAIPVNVGLVKRVYVPAKNESVLRFKNATEAFLQMDIASHVYVGRKIVDGIDLDVWVAREMENGVCRTIYELLLRNNAQLEDEKGQIVEVTVPWALRVYNSCIPSTFNDRKKHEFYSIVPFSAGFVPWKRFDVSPCLQFTKSDSYLMVVVNATMDVLSSCGIELVENFMRQSLAHIAGVSPIRVTRFMFQPNGNGTFVFFQVANSSSVVGTKTEFYQAERDVLAARRNLNQTLLNDFVIVVPREKGRQLTIAIVGGTLSDSYVLIHGGGGGSTIIQYLGYSGGSMAGIGISMLMLGTFFGLIVGFYLWKRNRGIVYQMYE